MMRTKSKPVRAAWLIACLALPAAGLMTGCQSDYAGQTLPSPWYLNDDVQYYAPGPGFKLARSRRHAGTESGRHFRSSAGLVTHVRPLNLQNRQFPPVPLHWRHSAHNHPNAATACNAHRWVHAGRRSDLGSPVKGGTAPYVAGASRTA